MKGKLFQGSDHEHNISPHLTFNLSNTYVAFLNWGMQRNVNLQKDIFTFWEITQPYDSEDYFLMLMGKHCPV